MLPFGLWVVVDVAHAAAAAAAGIARAAARAEAAVARLTQAVRAAAVAAEDGAPAQGASVVAGAPAEREASVPLREAAVLVRAAVLVAQRPARRAALATVREHNVGPELLAAVATALDGAGAAQGGTPEDSALGGHRRQADQGGRWLIPPRPICMERWRLRLLPRDGLRAEARLCARGARMCAVPRRGGWRHAQARIGAPLLLA